MAGREDEKGRREEVLAQGWARRTHPNSTTITLRSKIKWSATTTNTIQALRICHHIMHATPTPHARAMAGREDEKGRREEVLGAGVGATDLSKLHHHHTTIKNKMEHNEGTCVGAGLGAGVGAGVDRREGGGEVGGDGDGAFQNAGEHGGEGTRDAGGGEEGVGVDAAVGAARARQDDLSRKMRGLKNKRRKFTRGLSPQAPSEGNQKNSSFDFAAYWEQNGILPAVNAQQVRAATAPAKARSPRSKVKRDRRALKASLEASITKRRRLQLTGERNEKKIANLKNRNNQLMQDIIRERRASNKIIDEAMSDARKLSTEALELMREANQQMIKADERVISERNRASAQI
jgi:hypothetical protein